MNPPLAQLSHVTKKYAGFDLSLDLDISRGLVTGLVGANGAGKTTTLKLLLGMVVPTSGTVGIIDRSRVGVVLDSQVHPAQWRVRDVAAVHRTFHPQWSQQRFTELCDQFRLPITQQVGKLSRGMGMKLQLATALSANPDLLILDEVTAGLDPNARDETLDLIAEFMTDENHAVIMSTHITSDLERIADVIAVIDQGRMVAHGMRDDLLTSYALAKGPGSADGVRDLAIGLRTHSSGWDALVPAESLASLPPEAVAEAPSLHDLTARLSTGSNQRKVA